MFEKLKDILVEQLQIDPDKITMESTLAQDLAINSIDLVDLIMLCEEKFDIKIEDEDANTFVTVGYVVKYLESL